MRYLYGATHFGGQALQSFRAAVARIDRHTLSEAWRIDDFWANYGWLITTSVFMILCYLLQMQNAGVFLLVAVVHSVYMGGMKTGIASATLSTLYSAIFLSSQDQLFHYSGLELKNLLGISLACYGTVWLITRFRRLETADVIKKAEEIRTSDIRDESERRFQEMADTTPALLWMADARGRRSFFNKPWLDLTGRALDEQTGDGWYSSVHPEDVALCRARYSTAVRSGEKLEVGYRLRTRIGEYRWVYDIGIPRIGENGEICGYVGSCVDRTERKRVETALHQLSGRLLELQDDERRRISRELHDTTAQNLAVLSMNLCVLKDATKILGSRQQQAVAESLGLAERCSQEIRTLSYLLHPPLLDELGLVPALRAYTAGFNNRTNIQVELKMAELGRMHCDIETTIFRIVQEALTNVHRHSGSSRAEIRIIRDPKEVHLHVSDDGQGMPAEKLDMLSEGANLGVGVAGMRERAGQLGGQLKIASSPKGTTITAILPLGERE